MGEGHSPRHQPLHRSGNPAGGDAHQTRGESTDGQEVISTIFKHFFFLIQLLSVAQDHTAAAS